MSFLPVNKQDMEKRGWDQCDFILISGDAYVDHPSWGGAVISRVLEAEGFRVGIIAQPDWKNTDAFRCLGEPRLAFLVTAGNIDSMVNHYSVGKKPRRDDLYSPGGKSGYRPDRATIVYTGQCKAAYKGIPVIIGGIEASLRRLSHYDYWSDKVRRSILLDSKADMLIYGMGEKQIRTIAGLMNKGVPLNNMTNIRGTVFRTSSLEKIKEHEVLPSYEDIKDNKKLYARSFAVQYGNTDPHYGKILVEKAGNQWAVQNPPEFPLSSDEFDRVYELPYVKEAHPVYEKEGGIPALKEIKFSLIHNRGCFGSCSFCALTFHQGRIVTDRSNDSVVREAENLRNLKGFKGNIHDVGGPTADFTGPSCKRQEKSGSCPDRQCLYPKPCRNLNADHSSYVDLLRRLRDIDGIKKVFIRSGVRFDYILADKDDTFFREMCRHHISGQLKIAPEHVSSRVLKLMGKPDHRVFEEFTAKYIKINKELNKDQYIIPYFISSHPGSGLKEAVELAEYLRDMKFTPDQVQDFYPTPGTLSTAMYFTGIHPLTGEKVYVARDSEEKAMQRALLQFRKKENLTLVRKALRKAGRGDLIGRGPKCLVN
ncbi:YgiQ family radical SAM protein [Spirochaeta isovalerica]|uniref:Putative radical SAM protein YgiQ n=1 Tax=Spirochaeta isovalerica TaxID=150 RepID=A0A841RD49_9SPIO|nr:YgiQ family radical SAM protein [Spirochaeta isovalerica]MBB6480779.1 putative radical SAM protein YgiQ [Spirochaeta isovalerica]